jgi:hypothetical protein
MTKSEIFKSKFPELKTTISFFTEDCEQLNFIDVPNDIIEFTTTTTLSCMCCNDIDSREEPLSHIMDLMSDEEFDQFCGLQFSK